MGPVNNNFGSTPNYLPFSFLLFSSLLLYLLLLVPFLIRMIWTVVIYLFISTVVGLELDINDKDSICAAGAAIVQGQWNYYDGFRYGGTIGKFTWPYYWWQAGEAFGGMLNYYSVCDPKNGTLRKLLFDGMYVQAGENFDYIPANESYVEGNDDHGIWGLTVMEAVERNFTNPEEHSWLELTQAVYNTMNARWDPGSCGGGLRWQIFQWNSGYDYKNTISNGCLFQISARLARYTNNDTYAETAEKVWDWITEVGYVTYDATIEGKGGGFVIYDGGTTGSNCTKLTKIRWSYNYGMFMAGCAYMYNYTGEEKWAERAEEILNAGHYFFEDDIMQETFCHPNKCNNDQRSFRGLWSRFLASTSVLVPQLESEIRPFIEASAKGAAASCSGGTDGVTCGIDWAKGSWDGQYGLGEQMSALEIIMALLVKTEVAPYTSTNGGVSASKPDAGLVDKSYNNRQVLTIETKDKVGAGILTAVFLLVLTSGAVWMFL